MKKKFLVAFLTMTLAAASVACADTAAGNDSAETVNEAATETSEEAAAETSISTEAAADAASEASSALETSEETSDKEYTSGVINGKVYENELFNVKFTVDDDMEFGDEDMLAQLNNFASEEIFSDNAAAQKLLDEGKVMVVAYAADENMLKSFNVAMQSVGAIVGAIVDEDTVINASIDQVASVLESQGFEDVNTTVEKISFTGEDHSSILITSKISGIDYYERIVCLVKDGYVATFTAAGLSQDEVDNMFANAEKLN